MCKIHSSVHTVRDNADRIKALSVQVTLTANNLKQGVCVCIPRLPRLYWNKL